MKLSCRRQVRAGYTTVRYRAKFCRFALCVNQLPCYDAVAAPYVGAGNGTHTECESCGGGNSTEKLDITGARALRTVSCAKQQRELQIFELRTV